MRKNSFFGILFAVLLPTFAWAGEMNYNLNLASFTIHTNAFSGTPRRDVKTETETRIMGADLNRLSDTAGLGAVKDDDDNLGIVIPVVIITVAAAAGVVYLILQQEDSGGACPLPNRPTPPAPSPTPPPPSPTPPDDPHVPPAPAYISSALLAQINN